MDARVGGDPGGDASGAAGLADALHGLGLGRAGADAFAGGAAVPDVSDRLRLVQLFERQLGLSAGQQTVAIGLLIPAIQAARERAAGSPAARRLEALGVSKLGVSEFLAGRPVSLPADRKRLRIAAGELLGRGRFPHTNGANMMMMDGSVR